ncbi:MAG: hypothetical protein JNL21_07130 [Myxococcales bacterium]|nr:hypothetical protein [Myxococcales bacterium]
MHRTAWAVAARAGDVSRRTLETYPERALAMLRTLGTDNGIRATMLSYGYSDAELDRLDALESDPRREETRDDDLAALSLLRPVQRPGWGKRRGRAAQRGLDGAERDRLRAHIDTVRRALGSNDGSTRTEEGNQLARLTRLRAWYDEWVAVCRVALRPELLKRVGL